MSVVPPLLLPFLTAPGAKTLTLVTSTLSTTSSWLVLRYVYVAVIRNNLTLPKSEVNLEERQGENSVVLVSWLRDEAWWKDSARKLVSLARRKSKCQS